MIKKALSEFREVKSSVIGSVSNGKERSSAVSSDEQKVNGKGTKVTVSDTNTSKPKITLEKTAKEDLEPGDILLMSSMKVPGKVNSAIRAGSTATQAGLNHAAIYVGDGKIVEGRIKRGIKSLSLNKGTRGLSYTVVRPNLPRRVRKRAANVAKSQVGKKYNAGDLVRTGALLGLVPDGLRKRVLKSDGKSIDELDSMQCAALVAGSYQKAGKKLNNMNYRYVAPVDLLSKTDSRIIKMKKAKGDVTQGTPFSFTGSASKAKEKLQQFMNKTASVGELSMFCHVDATDWCPNGDVIAGLSKFFTKEVDVSIYPRYLIKQVWEQDHPGKTYDKDYYAFRAYAGPDYCKIFVDETETKDSVLWVMLHELAHIALASAPYLFKAYRHLTPDDYFSSDEAHESDPEEQMANSIAMSWMDMLGYGKVNYPRHWWRERTLMNKTAKVNNPNLEYVVTDEGVEVYDTVDGIRRKVGGIKEKGKGKVSLTNLDKEYRGQGIGSRMYDELLNARGGKLKSDSLVSNNAEKVYERMGKNPNNDLDVTKDMFSFKQRAQKGNWLDADYFNTAPTGSVYEINKGRNPTRFDKLDDFGLGRSDVNTYKKNARLAKAGLVGIVASPFAGLLGSVRDQDARYKITGGLSKFKNKSKAEKQKALAKLKKHRQSKANKINVGLRSTYGVLPGAMVGKFLGGRIGQRFGRRGIGNLAGIAGGIGTGTGLGYLGTKASDRARDKQIEDMAKKASILQSSLIGTGLGATLGGVSRGINQYSQNQRDDYERAMSGKKGLSERQKRLRSEMQKKQLAASALKGGILGGALGFGVGKVRKGVSDTLGAAGDLVGKADNVRREAVKEFVREGDALRRRAMSDIDAAIYRGAYEGRRHADDVIDHASGAVRDTINESLYGAAGGIPNAPHPGGVFGKMDEYAAAMGENIDSGVQRATDNLNLSMFGTKAPVDSAPHPGGAFGRLDDTLEGVRSALPGYIGGGPRPDTAAIVPADASSRSFFNFFNKKANAYNSLRVYTNKLERY